jgi:hypothetical protein
MNDQFEQDPGFADADRAMLIGSQRDSHCWGIRDHPANLIHFRDTSSSTIILARKALSLLRGFNNQIKGEHWI